MTDRSPTMDTPPVVSLEEWSAAREALLVKEKAVTRARDALAAERRRLPWVKVDKDYVFEGPEGETSLLGLFAGRRQLRSSRSPTRPTACASRCARRSPMSWVRSSSRPK